MSNVENVCPQVLRGVARELRRLAASPPAGVKLVLREDDLTDVLAHIEGPAGTPYAGGTFRVRLALGRDFPAAPPRAYFLTKLFHPNVAAESGEVCVDTLARDWRPELGLGHALLALRCLLIAPNPDSALNADAAALLRDRYDDYFARAKLLTEIHARAPAAPAPMGVPTAHPRRRESGASQTAESAGAGAEAEAHASTGAEADARAEARTEPCAKRERRGPAPAARDRRRVLKRL